MYKIGELSKLSQIPVKTLRFYDNEGILSPDEIDEFTGYRYYSAAKLSDCYRVVALKELGFTLDEIRAQFAMPKEQMALLIGAKEQELKTLQAQTEQRMKILRQLQTALKEDESMYDIVVRDSDKIRVAFERRILQDRKESAVALEELKSKLPAEMIADRVVMIDYETEYRSEGFDTGIGIEITGKLPQGSNLEEKCICFPEKTASLICRDEEYDRAVLALNKYIHDNPLQIVGPTYKIIYEDGTVEVKIPVCKLSAEKTAPRNDDIQVAFVNDEQVIGHWKLVDYLPSREQFHPDKPKSYINNERIKELYFLPEGQWYWCFGWTRGYVLSSFGYPKQVGKNPYTIEEIEGKTYLFVEMKFSEYFFYGGRPEIWVFQKTDSKAYTKEEILIKDEIPDAPADDMRVLGEWAVCDLVKSIDAFVPDQPNEKFPYESLFWRTAEFIEDGEMKNGFKNAQDGNIAIDAQGVWRWSTGNVICVPRSTVSMYVLRKYGDVDYLFIQWKSGDYSYGGEEPRWYVFKRL